MKITFVKQFPMRARKPPERLAVCLSGGGHRATLFGLGVLLALVDRELNTDVRQISSVSGGSILNAFVANKCNFEKTNTDEFDIVARDLLARVVQRGVLTRWILLLLLGLILLPPIFFVVLAFGGSIPWWAALPLCAAWLTLSLLRGLLVEALLEARYFPPKIECTLFPPKFKFLRKHLGDLPDSTVEHVICCTDLTAPGPVYFSSRRKWKSPGCFYSGVLGGHVLRCAARVPIAAAVRASAAFPGIPPRIFRFRSQSEECWCRVSVEENPQFDKREHLNKTLCLADGGIWNNLGTQVLRELAWEEDGHDIGLVVANAAVAPPPQGLFPYAVPLWALFRSLLRTANIQFVNTVVPRLNEMRQRRIRRWMGQDIDADKLKLSLNELRLTSEEKNLVEELNRKGYFSNDEYFDVPVCLSWSPVALLNVLQNLAFEEWFATDLGAVLRIGAEHSEAFALAESDFRRIGTHLDRITEKDALALLANGYLNTLLGTAELKPLQEDEIERLKKLPDRLRRLTTI